MFPYVIGLDFDVLDAAISKKACLSTRVVSLDRCFICKNSEGWQSRTPQRMIMGMTPEFLDILRKIAVSLCIDADDMVCPTDKHKVLLFQVPDSLVDLYYIRKRAGTGWVLSSRYLQYGMYSSMGP